MTKKKAKSNPKKIEIEQEINGELLLPKLNSPFDIFSDLYNDGIIFLSENITPESATDVMATMLWLDREYKFMKDNDETNEVPERRIKLYINSHGGNITSGLYVILNAIKMVTCPVETVCIGAASSAASFILAAGTKGMRKACFYSKIMIHSVQLDIDKCGSVQDFNKDIKETNALNDNLIDILCKLTNQSKTKVKNLFNHGDKYFTPQEALEFGLIDCII